MAPSVLPWRAISWAIIWCMRADFGASMATLSMLSPARSE